ncbi:Crp/Fnr family transcriptional regulator [Thiorhodococcus minor]|uniref:Crp/Fnr family transcriptional regulator n=1 Tax=Thiorhodococcus minor TaxID=57489 RepID=A0A6M0K1P2_9GAMM|nr:Crp/Fnr family transcriptional regulator [Thiorhodococcus minor]NEV63660.1 Crp/Fnr family transcriptional regulator [Thiorhodococcus minor]
MLEEVELFEGLDPEELEAIERHAIERHYRKATVVIERGDEANTLYLLLAGKVKVYVSDREGKEVVLRELGPGAHFGELALLGEQPRTASVATVEDSRCLALTKRSFIQCLGDHPKIAFNLIQDLSRRLRALTESVEDFALSDVYRRLAKLLVEVATEEEGRLITPPYTQQALAARVGASREMISRILGDLKEGGYVASEGRRLVLMKPLPARH